MVNTSPSNAGGTGSIPGQGTKILYALRPKKKQQPQNRNNGVKDPTKTFKMVCIKKKNLKKKILDKVCGLNPEGTREP